MVDYQWNNLERKRLLLLFRMCPLPKDQWWPVESKDPVGFTNWKMFLPWNPDWVLPSCPRSESDPGIENSCKGCSGEQCQLCRSDAQRIATCCDDHYHSVDPPQMCKDSWLTWWDMMSNYLRDTEMDRIWTCWDLFGDFLQLSFSFWNLDYAITKAHSIGPDRPRPVAQLSSAVKA